MKKFILGSYALIIFIFILYFLYSSARQIVRKLASPIPTIAPISTNFLPTEAPVSEFQFDGKTYQFHHHKILQNETLELIPNFESATFSAQIMKENNCSFGINGGFYMTNRQPLGLFQIGNKIFGSRIPSVTFNGFFSGINSSGKAPESFEIYSATSYSAARSDFSSSTDFIFQSGPLIFVKNQVQPNFLEEDYSRRSLIAKTIEGDFYLLSIFEKNNDFNGPRLKDLKDIFSSSNFIAGIPAFAGTSFELVLNLDGGSASAFYDKNIQVEEFKPIGSFLCGKKK